MRQWHTGCRYRFGNWALALNDMPVDLERLLPPSDARRRKDLRLLEEGRYSEADAERIRIIKRIANARTLATKPHQPRWFRLGAEVRNQAPGWAPAGRVDASILPLSLLRSHTSC